MFTLNPLHCSVKSHSIAHDIHSYIHSLILQVEKANNITKISPVSVFQSLTDEISDSGVGRFKKFYAQVERYKKQLYQFVESRDNADPKSVHLIPLAYHMNVGISRMPVDFSLVPRFEERISALKDNLHQIIVDYVVIIVFNIIIFYLGYLLFVRYDKR